MIALFIGLYTITKEHHLMVVSDHIAMVNSSCIYIMTVRPFWCCIYIMTVTIGSGFIIPCYHSPPPPPIPQSTAKMEQVLTVVDAGEWCWIGAGGGRVE